MGVSRRIESKKVTSEKIRSPMTSSGGETNGRQYAVTEGQQVREEIFVGCWMVMERWPRCHQHILGKELAGEGPRHSFQGLTTGAGFTSYIPAPFDTTEQTFAALYVP